MELLPFRFLEGNADGCLVGEAPVLEALVDINAVSLARTELDPVALLMVRIAALAPSMHQRPPS